MIALLSSVMSVVDACACFGIELLFFHETGCPHCAKIDDFLTKRIAPHYRVEIRKYEIHEAGNAALMTRLATSCASEEILMQGTPAIFVGDSAFHGSNRAIQRKIEQAVRIAIRANAPSPLTRLTESHAQNSLTPALTLSAVISAAAVDAINPCACAVLVLLLGTILLASKRNRRKVLGAGFAFTAACYLAYFLMGVGLFKAIQIAGIQRLIYCVVSVLAIFIGLWNLKDAIRRDRWFHLEVPKSWQPTLKKLTSNITSVPGALFIGLLISLFLLPCTSGPYIVIIGMLSSLATRFQAFWLLLLYNAIFVLPFILITLGVGFGFTTTARIEMWRQKQLPKFHYITGIIMFALGLSMLALVFAGEL
ncbi:hypothetical protein JXJ21_14310 [candidate division KSB1 bacterium]|nr:hypothetical protein [candidate division KSB1 bacterium]